MPKYDYRCPSCKNIEEYEHGMMEDPIFQCGECFVNVERIISVPAGTHFKGQGWGKVYRVHKTKDNNG